MNAQNFVKRMMVHIAEKDDMTKNEDISIHYRYGYVTSLLQSIMEQVPEANALVEYHAAYHGFVDVKED
jgi:hypothetical protein